MLSYGGIVEKSEGLLRIFVFVYRVFTSNKIYFLISAECLRAGEYFIGWEIVEKFQLSYLSFLC